MDFKIVEQTIEEALQIKNKSGTLYDFGGGLLFAPIPGECDLFMFGVVIPFSGQIPDAVEFFPFRRNDSAEEIAHNLKCPTKRGHYEITHVDSGITYGHLVMETK
jgi:hypothetical protein